MVKKRNKALQCTYANTMVTFFRLLVSAIKCTMIKFKYLLNTHGGFNFSVSKPGLVMFQENQTSYDYNKGHEIITQMSSWRHKLQRG